MSIFLRSQAEMTVTEPDAADTAGDLLADGAGEIWLENAEEPLDRDAKLADLPDGANLSRSTCRRVATRIQFNDEDKDKQFPPGTTVGRVLRWAVGDDGFNLPKAQRPKHTLALCGTTTQPEKSTHLSELVGSDCSVCFDLAPKERFEG